MNQAFVESHKVFVAIVCLTAIVSTMIGVFGLQ